MLPIDYVTLAYSVEASRAALREISGREERMIQRADTLAAITLLDHLLLDVPGSNCKPGSASRLTAADRDRLLAAVYRRMYGQVIATTLTCSGCKKPFDLDFNLGELEHSLDSSAFQEGIRREGEAYQLSSGVRFRLPTGQDELAVNQMPPDLARSELLHRCYLGDEPVEVETVLSSMQAVAPFINLDLQAQCPECGETQSFHFDLQRYLLRAIQIEQPALNYQIHLLASAYGWSLESILGLPRSQRLVHAGLIEDDPHRRERKAEI